MRKRKKPVEIARSRTWGTSQLQLVITIPRQYNRLLNRHDRLAISEVANDGLSLFEVRISEYESDGLFVQTAGAAEALPLFSEAIVFSIATNVMLPIHLLKEWLDKDIVEPTLQALAEVVDPRAAERFALTRKGARHISDRAIDALCSEPDQGTNEKVLDFIHTV
jgi:hypothetical protein